MMAGSFGSNINGDGNGGDEASDFLLPLHERKRPAKRTRTDFEDDDDQNRDRPDDIHRPRPPAGVGGDKDQQQQQHLFKVVPLKSKHLFRTMDDIHRTIDLKEPVIQMFLNSKYYQRLARIKQLGSCFLVYRGATHTRFEHSLGVAHLAKKLCDTISEKQPGLHTTKRDILCVTLAALCHDLGHGPFSHIFEMFRVLLHKEIQRALTKSTSRRGGSSDSGGETDDGSFFGSKYLRDLKRTYDMYKSDYEKCPESKWPHEKSSLSMIDAILLENGLAIDYDYDSLDKPLKQVGDGIDAATIVESSTCEVLTNRDFIFIKECIMGDRRGRTLEEVENEARIQLRVGREDEEKEWLYDVVSNRHNGIDVDKMDYFVRDAKHTIAQDGIMDAIIDDAIVAVSDTEADARDHYMICYALKRLKAVQAFFNNRFDLHEQVYQHKTTSGFARMIVDIFLLAEPYFRLGGKPLSLCVLDAETFYKCDDEILTRIECAAEMNDDLKPALNLIERFKARVCYGFAGEKILDIRENHDRELWDKATNDLHGIAQEIFDVEGSHADEQGTDQVFLNLDDIIVDTCFIHEGQKDKNPLEAVRFVKRTELKSFNYTNDDHLLAHQVDLRHHPNLTKNAYSKRCLRFYARDPSNGKTDLLRHKFETWDTRQEAGELNANTNLPAQHRRGGAGEDDDDEDDDENSYGRQPVMLTQDDEYTPPPLDSRRRNMTHHHDDDQETPDHQMHASDCLSSPTNSPPRRSNLYARSASSPGY